MKFPLILNMYMYVYAFTRTENLTFMWGLALQFIILTLYYTCSWQSKPLPWSYIQYSSGGKLQIRLSPADKKQATRIDSECRLRENRRKKAAWRVRKRETFIAHGIFPPPRIAATCREIPRHAASRREIFMKTGILIFKCTVVLCVHVLVKNLLHSPKLFH